VQVQGLDICFLPVKKLLQAAARGRKLCNLRRFSFKLLDDYTSQQDFGTRKVYRVSNTTFHAESKYAIKIFLSPTVFVQWPF